MSQCSVEGKAWWIIQMRIRVHTVKLTVSSPQKEFVLHSVVNKKKSDRNICEWKRERELKREAQTLLTFSPPHTWPICVRWEWLSVPESYKNFQMQHLLIVTSERCEVRGFQMLFDNVFFLFSYWCQAVLQWKWTNDQRCHRFSFVLWALGPWKKNRISIMQSQKNTADSMEMLIETNSSNSTQTSDHTGGQLPASLFPL